MSKHLTVEYVAFDFDSSELAQFKFDFQYLKEFGYIVASKIIGELELLEIAGNISLVNVDLNHDRDELTYQFEFTREITDTEIKAMETNDFNTKVFTGVDIESDIPMDVEFTLNSLYLN